MDSPMELDDSSHRARRIPTPNSSATSVDLPQEESKRQISEPRVPLEEYIPLGCLIVGLPDLPSELVATWTELQSFGQPTGLPPFAERLLQAKWIRILASYAKSNEVLRIYLLPDDVARSHVSRASKALRSDLETLLSTINVDPGFWDGIGEINSHQMFEAWASAEDGSLFYIFNTLPSPDPQPECIKDRFARDAVEDLLDGFIGGMQTTLYPYQLRTAAMMLQRESAPEIHLDPRFEERKGIDGSVYYFAPRLLLFYRHPQKYEQNRGGILAETMGLGKTIMCLAVILATKNHLPKVPPHYQARPRAGEGVPKLMEMALWTAGRNGLPTKSYLERLRLREGFEYTNIKKHAEANPPQYFVPRPAPRKVRRMQTPPSKLMTVCSGTIVVVPRNLVSQWRSEIQKHVSDGPDGLKLLVVDSPRAELPSPAELRHYDVVLFSKSRFEREIRDGSDKLVSGACFCMGCTHHCRAGIRAMLIPHVDVHTLDQQEREIAHASNWMISTRLL
jgi:hypothetical protein